MSDSARWPVITGIAIIGIPLAVLIAVPSYQWYNGREIRAAEERVAFLEKNGASADELCRAKRAVQDAYLEAGDAGGYRLARLYADVECNGAALNRLE